MRLGSVAAGHIAYAPCELLGVNTAHWWNPTKGKQLSVS